jgi:hypothetical protein
MIDLLWCSDQHKFKPGQYLHYMHGVPWCREIPKCSIKFRCQLHIHHKVFYRTNSYILGETFKRPHETEHQLLLLDSVIINRVDLFSDQVLRVEARTRPIEDVELHDGLVGLRHHSHFYLLII